MADYSDLNQYASEVPGDRVFGFTAVVQHLDNLLAIRKRELLFEPDVGGNLEPFLFKPIDTETALGIYTAITSVVRSYDRRVLINNAKSRVTPIPAEMKWDILLVLSISGLTEQYDYHSAIYSAYRRAA